MSRCSTDSPSRRRSARIPARRGAPPRADGRRPAGTRRRGRGALHLDLRPCDLADVGEAAADSLASRFEHAGISLERALTPAPIRADPRWLHQVVTNLLTNALKFSASGTTVSIEVTPAGPDAILQVTDHGSGIAPAELPHIFDRFWRGREAARISGSGIGLAVAAELAAAHGGELIAVSELGRGTRMTLRLSRPALFSRWLRRPAGPAEMSRTARRAREPVPRPRPRPRRYRQRCHRAPGWRGGRDRQPRQQVGPGDGF